MRVGGASIPRRAVSLKHNRGVKYGCADGGCDIAAFVTSGGDVPEGGDRVQKYPATLPSALLCPGGACQDSYVDVKSRPMRSILKSWLYV